MVAFMYHTIDKMEIINVPAGVHAGSGILPGAHRLEQNYPNPFNAKTRIVYGVRSAEFVELNIYDVLGREVARLISERKNPGTYSAVWDATREPSGVYFARLRAGGFTGTRKLVLLR
jgi:hypothetical protein